MTARLSEQVHSTEGESSCDDRASLPSTLTDLINRLHNSATKATRLGNQHRHFAADLLLLGEQLHEFAGGLQEIPAPASPQQSGTSDDER
ncbi:hypothetical protein FHX82_005196 [Amycolatopsis bartoniae]|uniref:Uncharacterized protein n=1 Tax=Amycolatopsis bartoniae TaxID=941986 RepID=A0A8H9M7C9_9PSEU|nr:hypothetical protein [Amycolatopsis bartoniae]MBB2938120.1 hypothetical protein [Amycolatopsis bartoniae]TVT01266.1 hypothetical protein FNH07_29905 [Amycolatopsis bartoniae]GHF32807.1 hypothetical protein GCM10017566_01740 [Amycolatopsis bartoniae]